MVTHPKCTIHSLNRSLKPAPSLPITLSPTDYSFVCCAKIENIRLFNQTKCKPEQFKYLKYIHHYIRNNLSVRIALDPGRLSRLATVLYERESVFSS